VSDTAPFAAQHVVEIAVDDSDIDAYDHVNNAVYLQWCDRAAWSHSLALGVSVEQCVQLRRGMVVHRAELEFLRGALRGDIVTAATAIVATDHKLRVTRRFEIRRGTELLAQARIDYVCMNLDTGRAARLPPAFVAAYVAGIATVAAMPRRITRN
jgi:acyl-CoA thioester hydrolase